MWGRRSDASGRDMPGHRALWWAGLAGLAGLVSGQNDTVTTSGGGFFDDSTVPVAVLTISVLAFCIIAGFAVSRLVDHCHDRRTLRDDASDISDYTKELLRAQLFLAFTNRARRKRKRGKEKPEDIALRLGLVWRAKAVAYKARRLKELKEKRERLQGQGNEEEEEDGKDGAGELAKGKHAKKSVVGGPSRNTSPERGVSGIQSSNKGKAGMTATTAVRSSNTNRPRSPVKAHGAKPQSIDRPKAARQAPQRDHVAPVRVSTDEAVKATYHVESETASSVSSRAEYEFLTSGQAKQSSSSAHDKQRSATGSGKGGRGMTSRPISSKSVRQTLPGQTSPTVKTKSNAKPINASPSRPMVATSNRSPPVARGNRPATAAKSKRPPTAATGNRPPTAATGNRPPTAAPGNRPPTAATGNRPPTAATGNISQIRNDKK